MVLASETLAAPSSDSALCLDAIQSAERASRLPPKLLNAIGVVESGRIDPASRRVAPWPWTINIAGTGYFFETKAEAIAAVELARAAGKQSIDVGCMQVNLFHHPAAFASLDQAFEPAVNASYAAGFLLRLFAQSGNWGDATGAYHSQTPELSDIYRNRVAASWPGSAQYGIMARNSGPSGRQAPIDPRGIYTPEFRLRLAQDAADRSGRPRSALAIPLNPALARAGVTRTATATAGRFRISSLASR